MTTQSDNELLELFTQGRREDALAQLIERYMPLVYGSALRQLNDPASAEDVTQAVFIALWNKAKQLRNGAALPAWLLSATRFACMDAMKRKNARARNEQEASAMRKDVRAIDSMALSRILDETLAGLPSMDRAIVARRYLMSQSFQEIAASLAMSPDAARKRVRRALARLRLRLTDRGLTGPSDVLESSLTALALRQVSPNLASAIRAACDGRATPAVNLLSKHLQIKVASAGLKAAAVWTSALVGIVVAAGAVVAVATFSNTPNSRPLASTTTLPSSPVQSVTRPAVSGQLNLSIEGQVKRPGVYEMPARGINLLQFVVLAGGPDADITPDHARVVLLHRDGQQPEIPPNYLLSDLIASGPVVPLKANDLVVVLDDSQRTTRLGPQAADDYQLVGDEVLGMGLVNFTRGGLAIDRLPVAKDGSIAPASIAPMKVTGLNAQQVMNALSKNYRDAAAANPSPSTVAYVNIYLPVYAMPLGNSGPVAADHVIVPGDLLDVSIGDLLGQGQGPFELSKRVSADGSINLPFLGPLKTSGLKASDLRATISQAYTDARLVRNPDVSLKVAETSQK